MYVYYKNGTYRIEPVNEAEKIALRTLFDSLSTSRALRPDNPDDYELFLRGLPEGMKQLMRSKPEGGVVRIDFSDPDFIHRSEIKT